jgi:segregation and condensation protein A
LEDLSAAEMREELLWRLVEYQKYRNAAEDLSARLGREERYMYRQVDLEEPFDDIMPDIIKGLTLERLLRTARELVIPYNEVDVSYIAPIKVKIEDYIEKVRRVLRSKGQTTYMELTADCYLRIEFVAVFLSLLELYKREEIEIRQAVRFGDIQVYATREGGDGP